MGMSAVDTEFWITTGVGLGISTILPRPEEKPFVWQLRPVNLNSLLKWQVKPGFSEEKIDRCGCHAFRRGLATNLHRLGVPDKTIQAILRHSNLSTTMNSYVKSVPKDASVAMRKLEAICTQYAPQLT